MENITSLFFNPVTIVIGLSLAAFYISRKVFPVIIHLAFKKNLMDKPVLRSSHVKMTPNLGGVGIFIPFLLCICVAGSILGLNELDANHLSAIIGAISILFFIGVKDDLIGISPFKKLFGQFIAASIIVFTVDLRIESFYGVFGIGELSIVFSMLLTFFLFLFFANAFNLIDGIDGLAGVQGAIASFVLGFGFICYGQIFAGLLSFVLMACLLGFLSFNLSKKNKIFMGDSGSLFVGFLLILLAFYFLKLDFNDSIYILPNKFVLLFAVFSFPILDTIRVFFLRIILGKSPFVADRNHLHHKLLDIGFSHVKATITVAVSNCTLIVVTLLMGSLETNIQLAILTLIILVLFYLPFLINDKKQSKPLKSMIQLYKKAS